MVMPDVSPDVLEKLRIVQEKLRADNIDAALDKTLNMAYFIANTLADPESKLLVERHGKFQELKEFF